jgi:hypothetical protein
MDNRVPSIIAMQLFLTPKAQKMAFCVLGMIVMNQKIVCGFF